jgi:hypothetical protein
VNVVGFPITVTLKLNLKWPRRFIKKKQNAFTLIVFKFFSSLTEISSWMQSGISDTYCSLFEHLAIQLEDYNLLAEQTNIFTKFFHFFYAFVVKHLVLLARFVA